MRLASYKEEFLFLSLPTVLSLSTCRVFEGDVTMVI